MSGNYFRIFNERMVQSVESVWTVLRPYSRTFFCSRTLKFYGLEFGFGGSRTKNSEFGFRGTRTKKVVGMLNYTRH